MVSLVKGKYYLKIAKVDNYEELDEIEVLIDNEDINISLTSNYNGPVDDPAILETITNEEVEEDNSTTQEDRVTIEPVSNEIIDEPKIVPLINKEDEIPEPKEEYINNLIPEEEEPIINPYTGDDIVIYFTILVISSLTILGILRFKERC